jgi:hypothetical protein
VEGMGGGRRVGIRGVVTRRELVVACGLVGGSGVCWDGLGWVRSGYGVDVFKVVYNAGFLEFYVCMYINDGLNSVFPRTRILRLYSPHLVCSLAPELGRRFFLIIRTMPVFGVGGEEEEKDIPISFSISFYFPLFFIFRLFYFNYKVRDVSKSLTLTNKQGLNCMVSKATKRSASSSCRESRFTSHKDAVTT